MYATAKSTNVFPNCDHQKQPSGGHVQRENGINGDQEEIIHHDQLQITTDDSHDSHEEEVEFQLLPWLTRLTKNLNGY